MKKILSLLILLSVLFSLLSCQKERNAHTLLYEFVNAYGAEGIIYSPDIAEGEKGYITPGMIEKVYVFSGRFPDNFAVFLNYHPDFGVECGVFVCSDASQRDMVEEACTERIGIIGRGSDSAFVKTTDNVVFYSTMTDRKLAENLWREIIR